MSKVFVIPDVHLKPWMFDKVEELFSRSEYDKIVCLGDLVDDWDQEKCSMNSPKKEKCRINGEKHRTT